MENFKIKLNLQKIGAVVKGETIVLPKKAMSFISDNGGIYLDAIMCVPQQASPYGDSHFVKLSVAKNLYETMTDEQRKQIPIIGNARPMTYDNKPQPSNNDNAPF